MHKTTQSRASIFYARRSVPAGLGIAGTFFDSEENVKGTRTPFIFSTDIHSLVLLRSAFRGATLQVEDCPPTAGRSDDGRDETCKGLGSRHEQDKSAGWMPALRDFESLHFPGRRPG